MKIYNLKTDIIPKDAIYIGRPSKYGNPFTIGKDGTREQVIKKYKNYLYNNPKLMNEILVELRSKDLVCYCSPKHCHGDVIKELIENDLWGKF